MPIDHMAERLIITRLVLGINRAYARHYYPKDGLARSMELQSVGTAVFVGQAEGRPLTVSGIARFVELPRATVRRRLNDLGKLGYVVRKGRAYCWNPDAVNGPHEVALHKENVKRVKSAAKELAKLAGNVK